jgi:hypothetical protein
MKQRLPLALSIAALLVALLGSTPVGQAGGRALVKAIPFAQRAGYATRAGTANNAKALGGHRASSFALLTSGGKLPASLVAGAAGAAGPPGPKGDRGDKGDKGLQGDPGPNGVVNAYLSPKPTTGAYVKIDGSVIATLNLPAGRYVILGRVLVADTSHLGGASSTAKSYYADCSLSAGSDSDYNQLRGLYGGGLSGNVSPANLLVLHEFDAAGAATLRCSSPSNEPAAWANARITAIQVRSTVVKPGVGAGVTAGVGSGASASG